MPAAVVHPGQFSTVPASGGCPHVRAVCPHARTVCPYARTVWPHSQCPQTQKGTPLGPIRDADVWRGGVHRQAHPGRMSTSQAGGIRMVVAMPTCARPSRQAIPRRGGGGAEAAGRGCTSAPIPSGLQFPAGEAGRLRDEAFGQVSHHELQIALAAVKAQNSSQRHAPKPECGSRVTLYSRFSSMQAGSRPFPRSGRAAGRRLTGPLEEEVAAERRARRRVVEGCRPDAQAVRRAACRVQVRWVCTSYRDPATTPQAA